MAVNWSTQVYLPTYNAFARPVTVTPLASQPGSPAPYSARGIFNTEPTDVLAEEGAMFSDQRVILDILEEEFTVLPVQGDHIDIPANAGMPALGGFVVVDTKTNGGGETTLAIRHLVTPLP